MVPVDSPPAEVREASRFRPDTPSVSSQLAEKGYCVDCGGVVFGIPVAKNVESEIKATEILDSRSALSSICSSDDLARDLESKRRRKRDAEITYLLLHHDSGSVSSSPPTLSCYAGYPTFVLTYRQCQEPVGRKGVLS